MIRRLAVAAVAPLALTTLVACGGDDEKASDPSSASSSPEASAPDAAEELAPGEELEPAEFMEVFEAAFDDATTSHMAMTMGTGAGEISAEGDVDYTTEIPNLAMTMSGAPFGEEEVEVRAVDGVFYVRMPMTGEKFLKVDGTDPNNPLGEQFTKQLDPKGMFEGFEKGITSAVYEGEEEVDGDQTDAYTVAIDSAVILEQAGQELPKGMELPEEVSYRVNFDEDGLLRQMSFDLGEQLGSADIDMTDWGKDVVIEAPPADQVTDFPDGKVAG